MIGELVLYHINDNLVEIANFDALLAFDAMF
jgi:hypothetical protein